MGGTRPRNAARRPRSEVTFPIYITAGRSERSNAFYLRHHADHADHLLFRMLKPLTTGGGMLRLSFVYLAPGRRASRYSQLRRQSRFAGLQVGDTLFDGIISRRADDGGDTATIRRAIFY